jgi:hypothetical protein
MQDGLEDMRQILEQIKETKRADRGTESVTTTSHTRAESGLSEQDRIQTTTQPSSTFHVTPSMLRMDEIMLDTLEGFGPNTVGNGTGTNQGLV